MAVTLAQVKKTFPTYFTPAYTGRLTPELIQTILDLYSKKVGGADAIVKILNKPPHNVGFSKTIITRIVDLALDANIVTKVPRTEMKTILAQKIGPVDRKIYNTIREVTETDLTTTQKSKTGKLLRAPSWAKWKIVFATPQGETTVIPEQFHSVQYYKTEVEAQKALDIRKAFS